MKKVESYKGRPFVHKSELTTYAISECPVVREWAKQQLKKEVTLTILPRGTNAKKESK